MKIKNENEKISKIYFVKSKIDDKTNHIYIKKQIRISEILCTK